jgi:xanthine dehydrogenase YagR molybdenum-binding subunit
MALFEETQYDKKSGAPMNSNLGHYILCTCPDSPRMDVTFLDHPDLTLSEFGLRGTGESGLAGVAPAITSAVYHATGAWVRSLTVRIEHLI